VAVHTSYPHANLVAGFTMNFPRIILADDHPLVLEGLAKLVEDFGEVVGKVEDGRALLELAPRVGPDVVIMDISMPNLNGLEAARKLKRLLPETKIIFLTMHGDPTYVSAAFEAGASGFLLKRSAGAELQQAVKRVLRGQHYITPSALPHETTLNDQGGGKAPPTFKSLTPRQREVLQLIGEGYSLKTIASDLNISLKTVEFHKAKIMETLGVHTTAALTKFAISHGLVSQ
jgi:DNA-binding NarL/FixJ family response regulator